MTSPTIGIIGSGFGALAAAIELKTAGHDDIRLWERSDEIGGVWRDNTYPGAGCDVPSPVYSYSFEPNPNWSRRYALQPEIHQYIKDTADKYGIAPLVQFGVTVVAAAYDEKRATWTVTLDNGETQEVDLLVSAVGQLSRPKMPHIVGLESFEGPAFHSAQWDHSFDPKGKRVAVIGTGASAIQFVPHLAEDVAALTVFQRSPAYIAPKPDQPYTSLHRKMFGKIPATLRTERHVLWAFLEQLARGLDDDSPMGRVNKALCLQHLKKQVKDPVLRKKLTPDYPVGCKRVLFSNNYLPAIARPNVELVTEAVVEVKPNSVVAADGSEYDVDALVIGTGFDTQDFLNSIDITGVGGQKLASQWAAGARAYLGTYAPNFPNFFIMYGPNTNLGAGSIIYMLEAQARHMRQAVDRLVAGGYTSVAVTAEAEEAYDQDIQKRLANSVWSHCNSWYHHESGRITSNWPGATKPFAKRTKVLDPEAFEWTTA